MEITDRPVLGFWRDGQLPIGDKTQPETDGFIHLHHEQPPESDQYNMDEHISTSA